MTDEEIAKQVQNGDAQAFAVLVERYEQKMLRYTRKLLFNTNEIEDVVQEVFIKAFTNIKGFDAKRRFSPWLYRIAHNTIVNVIRKKSREPLQFFDFETLTSIFTKDTSPSAEVAMQKKEVKKMIDESLDKLSTKYKEPLVLYYLEEMSYKEIADILHVPVSTVGVRLSRGKKALHKIYAKQYE